MAKVSKVFVCSECKHENRRWLGMCPRCNAFGTLEETVPQEEATKAASAGLKSAGAVTPATPARRIGELNKAPIKRTPTGIGELDRVLGGGFVDAEVVLFAGAPGGGKSTLSLDVANRFAEQGHTVLYSSGEESEQQIALRAKRMGIDNENIHIVHETHLETVLGHVEAVKPAFMVVDSLQTLASTEIPGSIGSISQSKEAAHALTKLAKSQGVSMLLINQIIKSGEFAGSEAVQHIVDCSLMLESDRETPLKFLRATKNRFGDTAEVGVFQHSETGLEEVSDPSGIFLEESDGVEHTGTSCTFMSEGVRQIPVEVQALVSKTTLPTPRKQFNGVHYNRGQIVCAILDKFCNTKLFEKDVFISTLSGLKVDDPQSDLSIAASVLSSTKEKAYPEKTVFIGELGLTGQVRGGFMIENKIKEAERLGFEHVVIPELALKRLPKKKFSIKISTIKTVKDLPSFLKN